MLHRLAQLGLHADCLGRSGNALHKQLTHFCIFCLAFFCFCFLVAYARVFVVFAEPVDNTQKPLRQDRAAIEASKEQVELARCRVQQVYAQKKTSKEGDLHRLVYGCVSFLYFFKVSSKKSSSKKKKIQYIQKRKNEYQSKKKSSKF